MVMRIRLTVGELFRKTKSALESGGVEFARFEAEQLLQSGGIGKTQLITEPNADVSENISAEISEKINRRLSGEPLQYIIGEWEFYGLPFKVGEGVLIPRQDTETLVEVARRFLEKRSSRKTLDLCAGSGCIGISLAKLCGCRVKSYELSGQAFAYLERNIALNGVNGLVTAVRADVLSEETAAGEEFDIIAANPPYLTEKDMHELQTEVTHEPQMALFGGADGLDFYRGILPLWTKRLRAGGIIAAEIGMGQERDVMRIFSENGITPDCAKDACGIYRVVYGIKEN